MGSRQRKDPINGGVPGTRIRHGGSPKHLGDAKSQVLAKAGGALGNEDLTKALPSAGNRQQEILQFLVERLKMVHGVQGKENQAWLSRNEWYRNVFHEHPGFHLPDPKRWHESARNYKKATEVLCQGDLGRAVKFMKKGMEAEQAAFDSLPRIVQEKLTPHERCWSSAPVASDNVSEEDRAARISRPPELVLADRILGLAPTVKPVTVQLPWKPHDWWKQDEDEEKPEDDGA